MSSIWQDLDMDRKISEVLNIRSHDPGHHFGAPFMTPYQIALRFQELYPRDFDRIGKPVGGEGTGQHHSLAQYLAKELSSRIRDRRITNVEGAFLGRLYKIDLSFKNGSQEIISSTKQSWDLSMFRLMEEPAS